MVKTMLLGVIYLGEGWIFNLCANEKKSSSSCVPWSTIYTLRHSLANKGVVSGVRVFDCLYFFNASGCLQLWIVLSVDNRKLYGKCSYYFCNVVCKYFITRSQFLWFSEICSNLFDIIMFSLMEMVELLMRRLTIEYYLISVY